ncbi:hypothetical protein C5E06_10140 [Pseudoclavibacter sp. RFBI5]|nr:hypothetical protein C5E06_10140 [Pseudoclavibacter sp. RFBI5]
MIGYADLQDLQGEQRERIQALYDRSHRLWALPNDMGKIDALEEFIGDCERAQLPPLIASALFDLHVTYGDGGLTREALTAFARLMRHLDRYGDLVHPSNVTRMLNAVATSTLTMLNDPTLPLEQLTRVIDLVEAQVRRRGTDPVGVLVARAAIASARGDGRETADWIERWRSEASEEWRADDLGVIQIELPLIASFDLKRATETLEQRLRMVGIDRGRLDLQQRIEAVPVLAMLAFFHLRSGKVAEARAIADQLLDGVGIEVLVREAVACQLIPILEHRPDAALFVVDDVLRNLSLDESDAETLAAVARNRLLADPDGDEGGLIRVLAQQAAAALDRRGATDVHVRELADFWWAGLESRPAPSAVHDGETWGDPSERALLILSAGWLTRAGSVREDRIPVSLWERYTALFDRFRELMATASMEETNALAAELEAEGERLRCATTRFCVPLFHSLQSSMLGANGQVVDLYQRAQRSLATDPTAVNATYRGFAPSAFLLALLDGVSTPSVPWAQVDAVIDVEDQLRTWTGGSEARVHFARAEIAAHNGDLAELRKRTDRMFASLAAGEEPFDRNILDLVAVRQTALTLPDIARKAAIRVAEAGNELQRRGAAGWLCWMRVRDGDPSGATELAALLESVGGATEEIEQLPGWAMLEALTDADVDLVSVVDALLTEAVAGDCTEIELFAAASRVLHDRAPNDPRGVELRNEVERTARLLDERNGHNGWSTHLHDRWLNEDRVFGARA